MKHLNKILLTVVFTLAFSALSFGGQVLVKTMPLADNGIAATGIVRVVVKLTDDAIGKDCGVILHQAPVFTGWNQGMSIVMLDLESATPQLAGYNGTAWDRAVNVKPIERNKEVALWLTIDAENNVHALSAQIEGEEMVTTVFEGYQSRSINKGEPSDSAKYCSVFINDALGQTTAAVEVVKDAEIVASIEPYFTGGSTGIAASNANNSSIVIYPTMVENYLNVTSVDVIGSVTVFSLTGQQMLVSNSDNNRISVSDLNTGTYIVEVKTLNNKVVRQKFLKK